MAGFVHGNRNRKPSATFEEALRPWMEKSMHQLFDHLTGSILNDSRFEDFIDNEISITFSDNWSTIDDGIAQMKMENYSPADSHHKLFDESEKTFKFVVVQIDRCSAELFGGYHYIGSSVMNYEMANCIDTKMLLISPITGCPSFSS